MGRIKAWLLDNCPWLIVGFVILLCGLFIIFGTRNEDGTITVGGGQAVISESTKEWIEEAQKSYESTIIYAKESVPAVITNANGEEETIDVPTVESIDGGEIGEVCPDGEECGLGAYIYAPTETFEEFKDYTIGRCWDVDGKWDQQCWDLAALHWMNYTEDGRVFSTCGTGGAKGSWNCKEQNAGDEYDLVYNAKDVKTGDWVITGSGTYGHVCEAAGPYNNGYVACLGQNQNGTKCPGATYGSATNIINLNLSSFIGAFRPKTYNEQPEPTPTPVNPQSGDIVDYTYAKGDYFSKVLVNLGLDEGHLWGDSGTVRYYTKQLIEQNVLDSRGNVFIGVPFSLTVR